MLLLITKPTDIVIKILQGSIFEQEYDAIVNPANVSLLAGGGLCGLIHKQAGPELEQSCKNLEQQSEGSVVVTPAFNISNTQWVMHACGPRWIDGQHQEAEKLTELHETIVELALAHKFERIAIPAISTGIYAYPVKQAAKIALKTCLVQLQEISPQKLELYFVIPEDEKFTIYQSTLEELS